MNIHKNARLTPLRREEMALAVIEGRLSQAQAARTYGVSTIGLTLPQISTAAKRAAEDRLVTSKASIKLSHRTLAEQAPSFTAQSALQKRLDWVAGTLKLDAHIAACLGAICRLTQLGPFRTFAGALLEYGGERDEVPALVVGMVVGIRGRKLSSVFGKRGQLMQPGLLEDRHGGDFSPSEMLLKILRQRTTDPRALEDMLIGDGCGQAASLRLGGVLPTRHAARRDTVDGDNHHGRAGVPCRRRGACGLELGCAVPGHGSFSRLVAVAPGGPRGCLQRSNVSMTIMRPPQQGHGGR